MIIVNDNVFNTDVSQPHIKHGTLNPSTDFATQTLRDLPLGTLYISRTGITGQPCGTTVTAACLWIKEGTAGSPCATAGSKSDWRRIGCGGFITGTAAPSSASPWCQAEQNDIYERNITGQTWKLYYMKTGNACDAAWLNLSKGCVFEDTHTPVGSTDADLCALPVSSFVHVNGVGTFIKVKNNCDGNDWVPLQADLTPVEDMRNLTLNPDDTNKGQPTYNVSTRTLNIPPRWVVSLRRHFPSVGFLNIPANSTAVINFDTIDINTSQNNGSALSTNSIVIPFNGVYRVTVMTTLVPQATDLKWEIQGIQNGGNGVRHQFLTFDTSVTSDSPQATASYTNPYAGGATLGMSIHNLNSVAVQTGSFVFTVELIAPK
jgi:hypothetical protein